MFILQKHEDIYNQYILEHLLYYMYYLVDLNKTQLYKALNNKKVNIIIDKINILELEGEEEDYYINKYEKIHEILCLLDSLESEFNLNIEEDDELITNINDLKNILLKFKKSLALGIYYGSYY